MPEFLIAREVRIASGSTLTNGRLPVSLAIEKSRRAQSGQSASNSKFHSLSEVTIRLDDDLLDWFRQQVDLAGGGNYQSLINDALRQDVRRAQEPLEATLRRVIREELHSAS
jgi:uncharacterized protein (DUF4415 family)